MHKYIITEKNICEIVGRLRKFFSSCQKDGMYDYRTSQKNPLKRKHETVYTSFPNPIDVRIGNSMFTCRGKEECRKVIIINLGINSTISATCHIGDTIYFNGGNMVIIRSKLFDHVLSKRRTIVYIRRTTMKIHAAIRITPFKLNCWAGGLSAASHSLTVLKSISNNT